MSSSPKERTLQLQRETDAVILPLVADPKKDIANERAKATFDVNEMSALIYGSAEKVRRRTELVSIVANDPAFSKEDRYFKNQEELYQMGLSNVMKLQEKVMELGLTDQEEIDIIQKAVGYPTGADLHFGMFLPTILGQGTPEQKKEFVLKALTFQLFGTYAQTELGHGTFLRGLETTATFDEKTQEFILHSPTLTATKWWPGGLAKTANYAAVMARLFIRGKDHGPHPFVVQIRDLQTHMPLPGIQVGDIGPKLGFNTVDNGFMRFEHYRVPSSSLLSKNAQVTADGKYVAKTSSKAAYGTMVLIRSIIVSTAASSIAKACTIATRYSAVRRQTTENPGEIEKQILDYQNQQNQLFPLIAASFALHFTGQYMKKMYADFQKGSKTGDIDGLPELHATSSGLKALVTVIASEAIESCRKACGGHGYSQFSGLPLLYEDYVAACTYEGENSIMHLQTARHLMKVARQSLAGEKVGGNCNYLEGLAANIKTPFVNPESEAGLLTSRFHLAAYRRRAAAIIYDTFVNLEEKKKQGQSEAEAWGSSLVDLIRCSQAHCQYILLVNFVGALESLPASKSKNVLKQLCDLFALYTIEKFLGEFTESGVLPPRQIKVVRASLKRLLADIRPNAVTLVDAWGFHDYELNSALGRYDGNVYEALFNWAQKAPLNKTQEGPAFKTLLKPKFTANL